MTNMIERATGDEGLDEKMLALTDEAQTALAAKEQRFVDEYLSNGFNATQAAIAVGYSERSARTRGYELVRKREIQEVIQAHLRDSGVNRERVLAELADIALNTNIADFLDYLDSGERPTREQLARVKSLTVTSTETTVKGVTTTRTTRKIELHDRVPILLKMLDRCAGIEVDNVPADGGQIRESIFQFIRAKVRSVNIGLPAGVEPEMIEGSDEDDWNPQEVTG